MSETLPKDKKADTSVGPVGQMMNESLKQTQKPPPTPREITWTLKPAWTVGELLDATAIGLAVSAGPANAVLVAPVAGKLAKGGTLTVSAKAVAAEGFAEAVKTAQVSVAKLQPRIRWRAPYPVVKGTKLGGGQLDAAIDPTGLALVYTPAANTAMNEVGDKVLKVAFAGDDGHETAAAQVTLKVLANATRLAEEIGTAAMLSGRGFKPPSHPKAQEALDNWNKSDPTDKSSPRGQAKEIMDNIHGKTPDELLDYMRKVPGADEWLNDRNDKGNLRKYPNFVWKLPNGLQVRYKPNGDGQNGLEEPMFCIEMKRTDIADYSTKPDQTALKVMPNGDAAPYGPTDMDLPDLGSEELNSRAEQTAIGLTHLFCAKPLDQVITWADPPSLEVGAALEAKHLAATALGGVVPGYTRIGAGEVKIGDVLPAGTHRLLASAAKTLRYKAGTKEVAITVTRKVQTLAWKGPAELPANGSIDASMVTALGTPVLSFTLDGDAITGKPPLPRGEKMALVVTAAETATHAAASVTAELTVKKSQWELSWDDPPEIRVGEKLTAKHLNAELEGDAALVYRNSADDVIRIGDTLEFNEYGDDVEDGAQEHQLSVTAPTTAEYEKTTVSVTIRLLPAEKAKKTPPPTGRQGRKK